MGSVDAEKDMAAPTESEARDESASVEEENAHAVVKSVDGVGEGEGEGKSVSVSPNEELNSKTSHDVLVEEGEKRVSDVSVCESVDVDAASMAVEPPMSTIQEPVAVSSSGDLEVDSSFVGDGLDATEKVGSWDLSEAVAKNGREVDDKEELRPYIPDEGQGEDVDAPAESVETIVEAPNSVEVSDGLSVPSGNVEDMPKDSQDAGDVVETLASGSDEVPSEGLPEGLDSEAQDRDVDGVDSEVHDSHAEGIDSEAQGAHAEEVDSEAQDPHAEGIDDVVAAAISAPLGEGLVTAEAVPASSDSAEEEPAVMKPEDICEESKELPLEGDVIESEGPHPVCVGGVERVVSELHYAPAEEVYELVEANTIEQPDEEPAESESMAAHSGNTEEKPVAVNSEDVPEMPTALENNAEENVSHHELPAEGLLNKAELPVEDVEDGSDAGTYANSVEKTAESESIPSPSDDVEEKSVETVSEDARAVLSASEIDGSEGASSETPAPGPSGTVENEGESVSSPSDDVEEKFVETVSEDVSAVPSVSESNDFEGSSSEITGPESSGNVEDEGKSVSSPSDDVEEKSVETVSEAVSAVPSASESDGKEGASSEITAPESTGNVENEGDGIAEEETHDDVEALVGTQPEESSANLESLSATANDVEDKAIDVSSSDLSEASAAIPPVSGENEDASPETPSQESADHALGEVVDAPVKDVHESTEVTVRNEPEEQTAEPESSVPSSGDVEDTSVDVKYDGISEMNASPESVVTPSDDAEVNVDDAIEVAPTSESADRESASTETDGISEAVDAPVAEIGDAKPDVDSSNLESVAAPSDPSRPPGEVKPEVSDSEMEEAIHTSLPAEEEPLDRMESSIPRQEQSEEGAAENEEETLSDVKETDAAEHSPKSSLLSERREDFGVTGGQTDRSLDVEELLQETVAELQNKGVSGDVEVNAGHVEGVSERANVIEEARPDALSVGANESETTTPLIAEELPIDQFIVSVPIEWADEDPSDAISEPRDEDSASVVATEAPEINDVAKISSDVNLNVDFNDIGFSEAPVTSDATQVSGDDVPKTEDSDNNATELVGAESHLLQTEVVNAEAASAAPKSVEDVSSLLHTEMTDEEIKLAALRDPESGIDVSDKSVLGETPSLETEVAHDESPTPLANASAESDANEVETASRDFNFSLFSKAFTSTKADQGASGESDHEVTPYLAAAVAAVSGEEEKSSDVLESDATPEETSSPPSVPEDESAPKSHDLDEVATSLHDVAGKTLEEAKTSDIGQNQESIAQSVAQIVIEDSTKAADSSEYISRVVQDVAQLAQDVGESDPNILPDTVARVWDYETASSPENEVAQPKVSVLIPWIVCYQMKLYLETN